MAVLEMAMQLKQGVYKAKLSHFILLNVIQCLLNVK